MSPQIKQTARGFERWLNDNRASMDAELRAAGFMAMLTLKSLDQPQAALSAAFIETSRRDLLRFVEAWEGRARP